MEERTFTVRAVQPADVEGIRRVLGDWLVSAGGEPWKNEIDERIRSVQESLDDRSHRRYFVATTEDGRVIGVSGLRSDGIDSELCEADERCVEVATAYVARNVKGTGVGRALVDAVERAASDIGFTVLLVVSGSRNRESGYPFWCRRYGPAVRRDDDFFGPGEERVVWRHRLRRGPPGGPMSGT